MAKMSITFGGFEDLIYQIDKAGGDVKKAANEALTKTQQYIAQNVSAAAAPYKRGGKKGYATGKMARAEIQNARVVWVGDVAEIGVGFSLSQKGGWHSIFVMYGTPRIAKDTQLFNAIKGAKTKKEIAEIQEQVLQKYLALGGGR